MNPAAVTSTGTGVTPGTTTSPQAASAMPPTGGTAQASGAGTPAPGPVSTMAGGGGGTCPLGQPAAAAGAAPEPASRSSTASRAAPIASPTRRTTAVSPVPPAVHNASSAQSNRRFGHGCGAGRMDVGALGYRPVVCRIERSGPAGTGGAGVRNRRGFALVAAVLASALVMAGCARDTGAPAAGGGGGGGG